MYVFIYGTLKRGFPNYDESLLGEFFLGECCTRFAYPLVVANQFYSPVLIDEQGSGCVVSGELYRVDQPTLLTLDKLEGVGSDWGYHRIEISIDHAELGEVLATTYAKHRNALRDIHSGALSRYELDLRYVHPSLRN